MHDQSKKPETRMDVIRRRWRFIKGPLSVVMGLIIGAICAIVVADRGWADIAPTSIVFVTILLVDINSAEGLYVTAVFRILGTLLAVVVGSGVSFIYNEMVSLEIERTGLITFQLSTMAILVIIPLAFQKLHPNYSYVCVIFIYSVTSLIFSGSTNAGTIATMVSVIGGIVIATVCMWMFGYESAEIALLREHRNQVSAVFTMIRFSVRANPNYKEEYCDILQDAKSPLAINTTNINHYERWMRWTGREIAFDFRRLARALLPLYHESASLFWSLCRDRILTMDGSGPHDPRHLYCSSTEAYFNNFHPLVTIIVNAVSGIEEKLTEVFTRLPESLLDRAKAKLGVSEPKDVDEVPALLMDILKIDVVEFQKGLGRMKQRYFECKSDVHPLVAQQWLMSNYMYQLSLVLTEVLEYMLVVSEMLVIGHKKRSLIHRGIRNHSIRLEAISREGFLVTDLTEASDVSIHASEPWDDFNFDDDLESITSKIAEP